MNSCKVLLLALLPAALTAQEARNLVPLKNWATPLYWHPSQAEREAAVRAVPQLQFSGNAVSMDALTFVAITPCRLVDTRGASGGFNGMAPFDGPAIAAGGTVTFPVQSSSEASANTMPAPCGTIPLIAEAYSFNLTVIPASAGAVNYVTLWQAGASQPGVSTLNDVQAGIVANAAIVPAGTPNGGVSVYNAGPAATNVIIDMNGYYTAPTDLNFNTALGYFTLADNTSGIYNTATGDIALAVNTTGIDNTATGAGALKSNTSGGSNTAMGWSALGSNISGSQNTAVGNGALGANGIGSYSTAIGAVALGGNGYGSYNIAIGYEAAYNVSGGNSNNIHIGSQGSGSDASGTIQIGTSGTQTSFFAAGISGVTTGNNDAVPVMIDSNGQLGTVSSSRRFKEDIQDMGDASSGLLRLRPVTFRYKHPFADGSKPIQYGLIAEEVGEVYPDLVAHSADGEIETVKYQVLDSMLLNELQKQAEQIRSLEERLRALETLLSAPEPDR
ncbi:MAG: tail fiber domain-containing protein [Bryobacterales bacterium]|nr:tail fiber domain-containing protein [Bryobacterales bacterium]